MESERPVGQCRSCTLLLIQRCYGRHWWFCLVREPLVWGMRMLAWWHRIDAHRYVVPSPTCQGCIRFMKTELDEKSPLFRGLNKLIGLRFKELRDSMLTEGDHQQAKQEAEERMNPAHSESKAE